MSEIKDYVWFGAEDGSLVSPSVDIPANGRVIVVGFNFDDHDEVVFDVVAVRASKPNLSDCCVPEVRLPEVYATTPMHDPCTPCDRLKLTRCRNILVIDQPEGYKIRGIRNRPSAAEVHVKMIKG